MKRILVALGAAVMLLSSPSEVGPGWSSSFNRIGTGDTNADGLQSSNPSGAGR